MIRQTSFISMSGVVVAAFLVACEPVDSDPDPALAPPLQSAINSCVTPSDGPDDLTVVDVSATPRADADAEIVALEASGQFIAPEDLFQRVAAELTGLRHSQLAPDGVSATGCGNGLIVSFDETTMQEVRAGGYRDWDALNENLKVASLRTFTIIDAAALQFEGRYNLQRVTQEYSALRGVERVEHDSYIGASRDLCLAIREREHYYIGWRGEGDCPSGCIASEYRGYVFDASGNLGFLGFWDGSGNAPAWYSALEDCRVFLYRDHLRG